MLKLRRIGVTGGISSGKTTVCQFLKELGAYVVSADQIGHHLLIPTTDLGKEVENLVGSDCIINAKFDREKISKKVFNNPDLLLRLEEILHPKIRIEIENAFEKASKLHPLPRLLVAEVPLLFEAGFESLFCGVIAVVSDEKICEMRYEKSGRSDFKVRSSRQLPPEEKARRSQYIIDNRGSYEELRSQVTNLFNYNLSGDNVSL